MILRVPAHFGFSKGGRLGSATTRIVDVKSPKIPTLAKIARMGNPKKSKSPEVRSTPRAPLRYGVGFFAGAGAGVAGFGVAGVAADPAFNG